MQCCRDRLDALLHGHPPGDRTLHNLSASLARPAALLQIVASWLISGTQVSPSDLSSNPLSFTPPATAPGIGLNLFTDADGVAFAEVLNAAGDTNNVVGLSADPATVCDGRGTLYVTDELILYPALLTRIRNMEDTPTSPCDAMAAAADPEDEIVPVNEAFLSNLEFELAGNKTTATIPISALVNSTAVDEDGNEVPVTTEVSLALMNDLDAALNDAGTEFNVRPLTRPAPSLKKLDETAAAGRRACVTQTGRVRTSWRCIARIFKI